MVYFLTSGHCFNKPQQRTKDNLVSWTSFRGQRPQNVGVASKVIKGEISVLSNANSIYFEKVVRFLLARHFVF